MKLVLAFLLHAKEELPRERGIIDLSEHAPLHVLMQFPSSMQANICGL